MQVGRDVILNTREAGRHVYELWRFQTTSVGNTSCVCVCVGGYIAEQHLRRVTSKSILTDETHDVVEYLQGRSFRMTEIGFWAFFNPSFHFWGTTEPINAPLAPSRAPNAAPRLQFSPDNTKHISLHPCESVHTVILH